ncbi:MAG TPA: hypothetical protein VMN78_00380 [Longimicrobiales bacterium]|nr:hypothetical protein [Longimicrobiales bacterium]
MFRLACERLVLGLLASSCIALPLSGQQGTAKPLASTPPAPAVESPAAASSAVVLEGNELSCLADAWGNVCRAATFVRGTWPQPTIDQYIYGAGIGLAGIVAADAPSAWAGDTIASYFFDARGTSAHDRPITGIYSSTRPEDVAEWPDEGNVADFPFASGRIEAGPFHAIHAGRAAISDQDTWMLAWEGDPALSHNREHPLGIAVEQRTMQWNAPEGLQSVIFLVYRLTNVTDLPVFRDTIAATYFDGNAGALPAGGWRIDSLFVGFSMDNDVSTDFGDNYAQLLPGFEAALTYHQAFTAEEFDYPADAFYPPFLGNSPGIVASALLHAGADPGSGSTPGARMMSVLPGTGCSVEFCDPGVVQWRYLSGHLGGGAVCAFPDAVDIRACFQPSSPLDVKTFQSVGPYSLGPGEQATVVFAMAVAPTADVPGLVIGGDNPPEPPASAPGCGGDPIGTIAAAAGWVSTPECPAPGEWLDPDRVETLEGSLLDRIQIARDFTAHGFLMPSPPERPEFHLLPGDNSVTVIWRPSPTEASGDPYHSIAQDSTGALYNPNYRLFDVEGYRIYRSTDRRNWSEVAQFDHDTTTFVDVLCETDRLHATGEPCTEERILGIHDFHGSTRERLTQYRPGDVVRTANGNLAVLHADTASAGHPEMRDTGVPFAWVDTDVRSGFRYYYQVRAFDVNSYRSGPSSLESTSDMKSVIVQPQFATLVEGGLTSWLAGGDGEPLDADAPLPTIESLTGVFSGPMPPSNALELAFSPTIVRFLPAFRLVVTIDSVKPVAQSSGRCVNGYAGGNVLPNGPCWEMYLTTDRDGVIGSGIASGYTPIWDSFVEPGHVSHPVFDDTIAADSASLAAAGAATEFFEYTASGDVELDESIFSSTFEGQSNRRFGHIAGGSRWFDGETETAPHPARFIRVGDLAAADTIWSPDVHHTPQNATTSQFPASADIQWHGYVLSGIARAADFRVTWQNGTIVVEDVSHAVPVPFKPTAQQNWGFVRDGNGNDMIDWKDFDHVDGVSQLLEEAGATHDDDPLTRTRYSAIPVVMQTSTSGAFPASLVATGRGFGLYLNTQRFIFETPGGALPPNGTVWTLRTYHGVVTATNGSTMTPTEYRFVDSGSAFGGANGIRQLRPPMVPGLRVVFEGTPARFEGAPDLTRIHTVPDPYYYHSFFGPDDRGRLIRFVNLPPQATLRIFSLAGVLVDVINHNDPTSGIATWDLRTRDGATAASGVYFFHVATPAGEQHIGRFTIVTSGGFLD